jgi:hypothetical protein
MKMGFPKPWKHFRIFPGHNTTNCLSKHKFGECKKKLRGFLDTNDVFPIFDHKVILIAPKTYFTSIEHH